MPSHTALSFRAREIYKNLNGSMLKGLPLPDDKQTKNVLCAYSFQHPDGYVVHLYTVMPSTTEVFGSALHKLIENGEETLFMNLGMGRKLLSISDVFRNVLVDEEETELLKNAQEYMEGLLKTMTEEEKKYVGLSGKERLEYWKELNIHDVDLSTVVYIMEYNNQEWFQPLGALWGSFYFKKQKKQRLC